MADNIDPYAIVTNGLIATKTSTFILDPLGYYVLQIEEDIVVPGEPYTPGGGFAKGRGAYEGAFKGKKQKRVKLCVNFGDEKIKDFCEEFYLHDFNLTIEDAKLVDDKIELSIYNPQLKTSTKKLVEFKIEKVTIDKTDKDVKAKLLD